MDFNSALTVVVSVFVLCAPCRAIILVKFPQLSEHFTTTRMRAAHHPDPLIDFGLISRQLLCDAVIEAKQFTAQYNAAHYKMLTGENVPMVTRTKWDDPRASGNSSRNYQRALASYKNVNLSPLRYMSRPLKFGKGGYDRVKALQCVNTMNVKWYITYGYMDHYMYLLEERTHKPDPSLRISGLFEPTPVISNRPAKYFSDQFKSSGRVMERMCKLGLNDHLRLCGGLLDVLNNEGSLDRSVPQMNLVRSRARVCVSKTIQSVGKKAKVLRCMFMYEGSDEDWTPIFALADIREPGAVFVFFENKEGNLYLHARVINITALLNPVGARGKGLVVKRERSEDESGGGKRKKQRTERNRLEDTGDNDNDDDVDHALQAQRVETKPQELEDSDHEDYIMHLLGKGRDEVGQKKKSPRRQNISECSTSRTKDKQKMKKKGSGKVGKAVSLPKKARNNRKVSSRASSKAEQKETEADEEAGGKGTSDEDSRKKVKNKDKTELLVKEKENAGIRTYVTRYRERKELQIMEDDAKNVSKKKKAGTEDELDDRTSEDSSEEEDSLDEDYNYESDLKRSLEDDKYEDIEGEDFASGWSTKAKQKRQMKKYLEQESVIDTDHSSSGYSAEAEEHRMRSSTDATHGKGKAETSRSLSQEDTEMADYSISGDNVEDETDVATLPRNTKRKKAETGALEDSSQDKAANVALQIGEGDTDNESGKNNSSDEAIPQKEIPKTAKTVKMQSRRKKPPSKPMKRKGKEVEPETESPKNEKMELSKNEAAKILELFKYDKSARGQRSSRRPRRKKDI